jgi:catechol 2,3-dioxygenase-like lactoylglutathione lyase family enzyme
MEQRISFVTLAVRDLDATRRFYVDGLGWEPALDVPGEVLMIQAGSHLVLSLWDVAAFEAEVGPITRGPGAEPVHAAVERDWGGYTGYFGDPDGFRWEIAWNPGPIGQLVLP